LNEEEIRLSRNKTKTHLLNSDGGGGGGGDKEDGTSNRYIVLVKDNIAHDDAGKSVDCSQSSRGMEDLQKVRK
jgi:hypothetical protein